MVHPSSETQSRTVTLFEKTLHPCDGHPLVPAVTPVFGRVLTLSQGTVSPYRFSEVDHGPSPGSGSGPVRNTSTPVAQEGRRTSLVS